MRKILITAILCLATVVVFAQAGTTAFYVDGIKVIFKPTEKEMVNVRVYFKGGVRNYTAANAGIENFALSATTECGTRKYSGDAFRDTADNYSINIGSESTYDYGDIQMQCISKYLNQGWDLFAEAVINPVFDAAQLELLRNKVQAAVAQMQSDPDKYIDHLTIKNAFAGTPYETDPNGTEQTLARFTAADLKAYYKSILNKNQVFIVVAGKITKQELIAKIHTSFAGLPSRPYASPVYKTPVWNDYKVLVEKRDISTNYINAIMNSPQVSSPDYVPFELGISVLSGSLFSDLRTQLNLSYDPGADAVMRKMPYSTMSVSTTRPKEAVQELVKVLKLVKQYGISVEGLKQLKSSYITTNYIKQQSTAAVKCNLG
jgi:zinc protease